MRIDFNQTAKFLKSIIIFRFPTYGLRIETQKNARKKIF
jgi:hypothetical protein